MKYHSQHKGNGRGDGFHTGFKSGGGIGSGVAGSYHQLITKSLEHFDEGLLCPNPQDLRALVINRITVLGSSSQTKNVRRSGRA